MCCGSLKRGMIGAAILIGAAAGLIAWQIRSSRAADDPPAGKSPADKSPAAKATPGKAPAAASDPFAVPDGKPPALMGFIAKMRRMKPPKNASEEDKKAFLTNSHSAMLEAADKILETKPVAGPRVAALKAKIEALLALKELGDDDATKKLSDLADELKDDKQLEVARLVKPYVGLAKAEAAAAKNPDMPRSWVEIRPKLAADLENKELAKEAIQSVRSLEGSGQTDVAV